MTSVLLNIVFPATGKRARGGRQQHLDAPSARQRGEGLLSVVCVRLSY